MTIARKNPWKAGGNSREVVGEKEAEERRHGRGGVKKQRQKGEQYRKGCT